jgi:hypothetical protein
VSPGAFTLFANFSASAFSRLSSASRSAGVTEQQQLVLFKIELKLSKLQNSPSMASSSYLRWCCHSSSAIPSCLEIISSSCRVASRSSRNLRASRSV